MRCPSPTVTDFDLDHICPKFFLREDLSPTDRMHIATNAIIAQEFKEYGVITQLAEEYSISRQFVYMLANQLECLSSVIFGDEKRYLENVSLKLSLRYMLSLRLEGRCSISAVSAIMKRFEIKTSSDGAISQYLTRIGSILQNTLVTKGDEIKVVVFLSDEIFSKNTPILITVDPISSAILRCELANKRDAASWKKHWTCIEDNGYYASYLVCDEGRALCSAHKESLFHIFRQSDTYHAIAHNLGIWVDRLEDSAYVAIEEEDKRYRTIKSAKSKSVIKKRRAKYKKAKKDADYKIDLYENYVYLYHCLLEDLNVFDSNGVLRSRDVAEKNIKTGLDLIASMNVTKLTKATEKVNRTLPNLFHYFDVAKAVVSKFEKLSINQAALQALCLAWQSRKKAIKSKKTVVENHYFDNEKFCLDIATGYLQENFDSVKKLVYGELDNIVQSSALVECINSILRPYLNASKNQISQETLNLIMFYHNHRRYKDGKRKNRTPMEILTGECQKKDWIELIFDSIEKRDPLFFALINRKKKRKVHTNDKASRALKSHSSFEFNIEFVSQQACDEYHQQVESVA